MSVTNGANGSDGAGGSGAVLTASTLHGGRPPGIVRVNLLPPEIREAHILRRAQLAAGLAVVLGAAIVALLWWQQSQRLDDANRDLAAAKAVSVKLKVEQARLGNVDALFAQVDKAEAMLRSASSYEIHMSDYLAELSMRLTNNVYFTSASISETPGSIPLLNAPVTRAGATGAAASKAPGAAPVIPPGTAVTPTSLGTITISGVGFVHDDVAAWLDSFAGLTGVTNVYLQNSTETLIGNKLPTVTFASTAELTLDALFTKPSPGGSR